MITNRPRASQFAGCLIGQCLGDALGFPVEGEPQEACEAYVEESLSPEHPAPRGRPPFPFGQYTDDSQLARELILSMVSREGIDPEDYSQRIERIFASGRIVGRGRATTDAALRLAAGVPWTESGTPSPSAGNGSAMRAAPVGLFFWNQVKERVQAAHDQGRITHSDPRCSAGAIAIAGAVAQALRPGEIDPEQFVSTLVGEVVELDASFAEHLSELPRWLESPPERAVEPIRRAGKDPWFDDAWPGVSPFVVGSVLWSLYSFLRSPDDYWRAIRTAIAVGGDVDTTAAMTGAISGSRVGLERLPLDLSLRLTDQGTWHFEKLVQLSHQLHRLATG